MQDLLKSGLATYCLNVLDLEENNLHELWSTNINIQNKFTSSFVLVLQEQLAHIECKDYCQVFSWNCRSMSCTSQKRAHIDAIVFLQQFLLSQIVLQMHWLFIYELILLLVSLWSFFSVIFLGSIVLLFKYCLHFIY